MHLQAVCVGAGRVGGGGGGGEEYNSQKNFCNQGSSRDIAANLVEADALPDQNVRVSR